MANMKIKNLLLEWIQRSEGQSKIDWLLDRTDDLSDSLFFSSFSGVVRFVGKGPLELTKNDLQVASN